MRTDYEERFHRMDEILQSNTGVQGFESVSLSFSRLEPRLRDYTTDSIQTVHRKALS